MRIICFLCMLSAAAATGSALGGPPAFPVVSPAEQTARDDFRRQLLQQELEAEQERLGKARSLFASGLPADEAKEASVTVARHEKNIQALHAELNRLPGTAMRGNPSPTFRAKSAAAQPVVPDPGMIPDWDTYRRHPKN
jgi:hypothetical protein